MKNLLSILLLLSFSFSQDLSIEGKVLNADNNQPIVDVNIYIIDSSFGVATDSQGDFSIENLENSKKTALMSVAKVEATHPDFCLSIKNGKMIPYKSKPSSDLSRRQDIDELYFIDGSIYISKITKYLETKTFYHEDTLPFIVPYWKSFEIDTYLDLICVESIINNIEEIKQNDK